MDLVEHHGHPNNWFNRASDLRATAGAAWFSMRVKPEAVREALGLEPGFAMPVACRPVYHLLCGLALEVLFKAVLVLRGQQPPAIHDLCALADQVGVDLSGDERELLRYFSTTISWGGRYPLPKNPTEEKLRGYWDNAVDVLTTATPISPGSFVKIARPSGADEWEVFHALYGRIEALRWEHEPARGRAPT